MERKGKKWWRKLKARGEALLDGLGRGGKESQMRRRKPTYFLLTGLTNRQGLFFVLVKSGLKPQAVSIVEHGFNVGVCVLYNLGCPRAWLHLHTGLHPISSLRNMHGHMPSLQHQIQNQPRSKVSSVRWGGQTS